MYRCLLLVPQLGCHQVLLLCHFEQYDCFPDFFFCMHITDDRQVVTGWSDVHWILRRWPVQKLLEVFHPSPSLSFLSNNRGTIFVFYGSIRFIKYSRERICVGAYSSHVVVVSCFLCLDSQAIQICSLVCSDVPHYFVGLCECCVCSDFL